ncbi:MAG: hypothetical protein U5N86_07820 [Planctomycetota bacterium]|nr:hypothetical protein [Planctomycetota bacterium]
MSYDTDPGYVHAVKKGNTFEIDASHVTKLRIMLNPDFVDFKKEIVVNVNGKELAAGGSGLDERREHRAFHLCATTSMSGTPRRPHISEVCD